MSDILFARPTTGRANVKEPIMTDTCEYLARVGYAALLADLGGPTDPEWADVG